MYNFNWLDDKNSKALSNILNEFRDWLKKNVTIIKHKNIIETVKTEFEDKIFLNFGKYEIIINSNKRCFLEIIRPYNCIEYKPKVNLFYNWLRMKKLKFTIISSKNKPMLCFSITKNQRVFKENSEKFILDLSTGKFLKKVTIKEVNKFKDFKDCFKKVLLKEYYDEDISFFNYDNLNYFVFLNKDIVIETQRYIQNKIILNYNFKDYKIIYGKKAQLLKEIFLIKDKIESFEKKNKNLVFKFEHKGFIVFNFKENKIIKVEKEAKRIKMKNEGFIICYDNEERDFYSFKDDKIYKRIDELEILTSLSCDYLITDYRKKKTRIVKVNCRMKEVIENFNEDFFIYNYNDTQKIILIQDNLYLLSSEFLSKFKKIKSLKYASEKELEEENNKNMMFVNL